MRLTPEQYAALQAKGSAAKRTSRARSSKVEHLTPNQEAGVRFPSGSPTAKKSKYKNRKVVVDGITFDSKAEAKRWEMLLHMERSGEIYALRRQVRFPIVVNGLKICTWIADFAYRISASGNDVVEDVKSEFTRKLPLYRLKYKLVQAVLGITIQEIV